MPANVTVSKVLKGWNGLRLCATRATAALRNDRSKGALCPTRIARWQPAARAAAKRHGCQRAILVGHNAHFDLNFLNAAIARVEHKRNPFHPFSVFDTVSLAGMAYGQTVLARAVHAAGLEWDSREAHSAVYDAERTAQLFCIIANAWPRL